MTRNMYFGADLSPLFDATASQLGEDSAAAYQQMQASAIPDRIEADAHEVAAAKPELVALQEAVVWSVIPPGQKTATVQYDFVSMLLADLAHLGVTYTVASSNDGFSGTLPVPGVGLVSLQDRDVILLRSGSSVSVSDPSSGSYQHVLTVNVAGVPITVKRGWTSVEATAAGRNSSFRVIATHLEAYSDPTRDAQANELLALVAASPDPTVVLGDVNSAAQGAGSQTYDLVRSAGLGDAWASAEPGNPGYTCCRDADVRGGSLTQRIDMVFYRGSFNISSASIVGASPGDRTPGGLWPSDHAGVVTTLVPPA
ncbi:MAG: endonuclease/exonuclease/phosphatase family protein [Acidimicrobiales bacterium]